MSHSCASYRKPFTIPFYKFTEEDLLKKPDCDNPIKFIFPCCGYSFIKKCGATKENKCYPCSQRSKMDKKLSILSGLNKSPMGWLELTLTAPGIEEIAWNPLACNHNSDMKCSGKIGCKVDEIDGAEFNTRMPKNWNRYMQAVRRMFQAEIQYGKVFEAQSRDVLHIHALLVGAPPWPIKRINKELRRLAKVHGMGAQISVKRVAGDSPNDKGKAVNYASKYLTKGSKTLKTVSIKTGEIRTGGYRDFTQSRHFGDTLKEIRNKRLIHWQTAQTIENAGKPSESSAEQIAEGCQRGDEIALDNYKQSYTIQT